MEEISFKALYKMIDNEINSACKDKQKLINYLNIQSNFYYSVNNCFLVLAQNPNAIILKEYDDWINKENINVLSNEKPIIIIEPIESKNNGLSTEFKKKYLYDITQTNHIREIENKKYNDRDLLKAMLNCYNFGIMTRDNLVDDKNANLDFGDNILYIKKGVQAPKVFYAILEELVKIELKTDNSNEFEVFQNKCCTYMLLRKYNIDTSNYDIGEIPYELGRLNLQDKKDIFKNIRVAMLEIDSKMDKYFNSISKEHRKQEYER